MRKTCKYYRLESITYRFDKYEIENALKEYIRNSYETALNGQWSFDAWREDENGVIGEGPLVAELIQTFTHECDGVIGTDTER